MCFQTTGQKAFSLSKGGRGISNVCNNLSVCFAQDSGKGTRISLHQSWLRRTEKKSPTLPQPDAEPTVYQLSTDHRRSVLHHCTTDWLVFAHTQRLRLKILSTNQKLGSSSAKWVLVILHSAFAQRGWAPIIQSAFFFLKSSLSWGFLYYSYNSYNYSYNANTVYITVD